MPEEEFTILDHIDGIRVPGKVFKEPANEYWQLIRLWNGMEYLFTQASSCDYAVKQTINPEGKDIKFASMGLSVGRVRQDLLTCAFDWYAISACQYVRTVGAIDFRDNKSRPTPQEYVENIIPDVKTYRDKVAAHFAGTTRNRNDNDAERLMSLLPQLSVGTDGHSVSTLTLKKTSGGKSTDSSALTPWSITKVHEELRKRYWPNALKERITNIVTQYREALDTVVSDAGKELPGNLSSFPNDCCHHASKMLLLFFSDMRIFDFEMYSGRVPGRKVNHDEHVWLQRGDLIVDITTDQFEDESLPSVIVTENSNFHKKLNGQAGKPITHEMLQRWRKYYEENDVNQRITEVLNEKNKLTS